MDAVDFGIRLSQLREQKKVSARDMSLTLGQNAGYINNIETGKALPSMKQFFFICEYFEISPSDFFNIDIENPHQFNDLIRYSKLLTQDQLEKVTSIIECIVEK